MAIPTDTWSNLMGRIRALAGVETFLTTEETLIASLINRRAYQAYNASDTWARYLVAGQARPGPLSVIPFDYTETDGNRNISTATRDGYEVTITTTADIDGDFVTGQSVAIASLTFATADPNGTFEVTVTGDDTFTYELADDTLTGTETYGGSGTVAPVAISDVNSFIRVHASKPFGIYGAAEYDFYTQNDGAHVIGNTAVQLGFWVTYKAVWGGPYDSVSVTAIPQEWFEYLAHAVYADVARMDKKNDIAHMEERIAANFLELELQKPQNQYNSQVTTRISTSLSRQARY